MAIAVVASIAVVTPLAAAFLHQPLLEKFAARAVEKVERRLQLPIVFERIAPEGLLGARVERVRIGALEAPLVTARRARVHLDSARDRRLAPSLLELDSPVLHVRGDGTLKGAARALRDSLPTLGDAAGATGEGDRAATRRGWPEVIVRDARVIDHGGAISLRGGTLTLSDGRFVGQIEALEPPLGVCAVEGDFEAVAVSCEVGVEKALPAGLRVVARRIEVRRRPRLQVTLGEVTITSAEDGRLAAIVGDGVRLDATIALPPGEGERWPVELALALPGGGRLVAVGDADLDGGTLRTEAEKIPVGPAHDAVAGALTAKATLSVDRRARTASLSGSGRLEGVTVIHPALAEGPVGPFDLGLSGALEISVPPERPWSAARVVLTGGRVELGEIPVVVETEGTYDATEPAWRLAASARIGKVTGGMLSAAVPRGLLPSLQPIELEGEFSFQGLIELDMAQLDKTRLEAKPRVDRLKIVRLNPAIRFDTLRTEFETRFEMPDGEVLVNTTGPLTERWTTFESLPPLLPIAVMTQEDGGFLRHQGVSMLHLRGSLVRNLERGRFVRGGSTITMQLARNLFLNRKKTLARKLEEVVLTWLLEKEFNKDELITLYLNVVEFGPGIFGIGDAARAYFDKEPWELEPVEIVFLVRLLPSPRRIYPMFEKKKLEPWYVRRMEGFVRLLVQRGHLSPEEAALADPRSLWLPRPERPPAGVDPGDGLGDPGGPDGVEIPDLIDESDVWQ